MAVWLSSVGMPGTWTRRAVEARTPLAGATSATTPRSSWVGTAPVPCFASASTPAHTSSTASQTSPTGNHGRPRSASHFITTAAPAMNAPIAMAGRATGTSSSPTSANDRKSTLPVASAQNTFPHGQKAHGVDGARQHGQHRHDGHPPDIGREDRGRIGHAASVAGTDGPPPDRGPGTRGQWLRGATTAHTGTDGRRARGHGAGPETFLRRLEARHPGDRPRSDQSARTSTSSVGAGTCGRVEEKGPTPRTGHGVALRTGRRSREVRLRSALSRRVPWPFAGGVPHRERVADLQGDRRERLPTRAGAPVRSTWPKGRK